MASYNSLFNHFRTNIAPALGVTHGDDKFNDEYNEWITALINELGVGSADEIPEDKIDFLQPNGGGATTVLPADQFLGNETLNRAIAGIEQSKVDEAAAQAEVDNIRRSLDSFETMNKGLLRTFDPNQYLYENPDVGAMFASLNKDENGKAILPNGQHLNEQEFAKYHYDFYGSKEGRPAGYNSVRLNEENAQAARTQAELEAAARLAATRRTDAATVEADARGANLDAYNRSLVEAIANREAARQSALDSYNRDLAAAIEARSQQRMAALSPLEQARVEQANQIAAGINQGVEFERDRITAADAASGYYGGSAAKDAALARATIGARQQAAETMGNARVANATDRRGIGDEAAGSRFDLAGYVGGERRGIADQGSGSRFDLTGYTAGERRGIGDTKAANMREIADAFAMQNQDIASRGTELRQNYFDADFARSIEASLKPAQLADMRIGLIGKAGEVGNNTFTRNMDNLYRYFDTSGAPMPQSSYFTRQADGFGADLAGLGSGLVQGGFNLAAMNAMKSKYGSTAPNPSGGSGGTLNLDPNGLSIMKGGG